MLHCPTLTWKGSRCVMTCTVFNRRPWHECGKKRSAFLYLITYTSRNTKLPSRTAFPYSLRTFTKIFRSCDGQERWAGFVIWNRDNWRRRQVNRRGSRNCCNCRKRRTHWFDYATRESPPPWRLEKIMLLLQISCHWYENPFAPSESNFSHQKNNAFQSQYLYMTCDSAHLIRSWLRRAVSTKLHFTFLHCKWGVSLKNCWILHKRTLSLDFSWCSAL